MEYKFCRNETAKKSLHEIVLTKSKLYGKQIIKHCQVRAWYVGKYMSILHFVSPPLVQ